MTKKEASMTLHPFTEHDWEAWAGAEPLPDGREPLIGTINNLVVIVSGCAEGGIVVECYEEKADQPEFDLHFISADEAIAFANRFMAT